MLQRRRIEALIELNTEELELILAWAEVYYHKMDFKEGHKELLFKIDDFYRASK